MRTAVSLTFLLVMLTFSPGAYAQTADELIKLGDQAYLNRYSDQNAVGEAINHWERAVTLAPKDAEPLCKIAMAYCYLGTYAKNNESARRLFKTGNGYTKTALANDSKSAAAHYWFAVTLEGSVRGQGKFARLAVHGDITAHLLKAKNLDEKYHYGGPDRALGAYLLSSPGPTQSIALKHLESSYKISPKFSTNLLFLGKAYLRNGDKEKAKEILTKLMQLKPLPGYEKDFSSDKDKAGQLLKTMD